MEVKQHTFSEVLRVVVYVRGEGGWVRFSTHETVPRDRVIYFDDSRWDYAFGIWIIRRICGRGKV